MVRALLPLTLAAAIRAQQRVSPRPLALIFKARLGSGAGMTGDEAASLDAMIATFLPVARRRGGHSYEGVAIAPAKLAAPVPILHAREDRIAPFVTATFAAARLPDAELPALETGGTLLTGRHDEVQRRIAGFLASRALRQ